MFRASGVVVGCLLFVLAGQTPAQAQGPLEAVSTDAGLVVRLKAPAQTREKAAALLQAVDPTLAGVFHIQVGSIGARMLNPTLAGVDQARDWWLAVYPRPANQQPGVVFIIPATDLKQMQQAVGAALGNFMAAGQYGVYTADADAADRTAQRLKGEGKSISGLIEPECAGLLDRGDVSVFVNVPRLVTVHRDDLEEFKEQAQQLLDNFGAMVPGAPGLDAGTAGDAVRDLLNLVSQGLDDAKSCTIAATFSKEGLYFEDLVRVAAGSKSEKLLQSHPPGSLALLKSLPSAALGYFGTTGDLFGLATAAGNLLADAVQADAGARAALDEKKKLKFGASASSFALGTLKEGALRTVSIKEVDQPAKLRELTNKMVKAGGSVETEFGVKQSSEVKEAGEQYGDAAADLIKVTLEAGDDADPVAGEFIGRFTDGVYGPEGMVSRVVYLANKAVQTSGGGKEAMSGALDALAGKQPGSGQHAIFSDVFTRLGDTSNLAVLFDLPTTVGQALRLVGESGVFPFLPLNADTAKALGIKPSYFGLSLATEPQGLRVRTFVSAEQARGIFLFRQLFVSMQGALEPPGDLQ